MSKAPTPTPHVLPSDVVQQLATLAWVTAPEQEEFHEQFSLSFAQTWQRGRAVSSKPGSALVKAARAAATLQKEFYRLSQQDRERVENFWSSSIFSNKTSLGLTI